LKTVEIISISSFLRKCRFGTKEDGRLRRESEREIVICVKVEEDAPQSEASSPLKEMRTDRDVMMEVQESYEKGERGRLSCAKRWRMGKT